MWGRRPSCSRVTFFPEWKQRERTAWIRRREVEVMAGDPGGASEASPTAWTGRLAEAVRLVLADGVEPPTAGEVSGTVSLVLAKGAGRAVGRRAAAVSERLWWRYEAGRPCAGGVGDPPQLERPDLELWMPSDEARLILCGEVEPSVSYMRGRLKADGDGALLLAVLGSTASDGFRAWREKVAAASATVNLEA
jgi:hypothetical protein